MYKIVSLTDKLLNWREHLNDPPEDPIQNEIGKGLLKKTYLPIENILGLRKLNTHEPTFKRKDWNIDHILVNFHFKNLKCLLHAKRGGLSDHFLVVAKFKPSHQFFLELDPIKTDEKQNKNHNDIHNL